MNINRRQFFGFLGTGAAAAALPGCVCGPKCGPKKAQIALQLYSIREYIGGVIDKKTKQVLKPGVGLEKALEDVAAIGYKGVEFAGYYNHTAAQLKKMLNDNGLKAVGCHIANSAYGINMKEYKYDPEALKRTCDFCMGYGNTLPLCPGGGNMPENVEKGWAAGRDAGEPKIKLNAAQADWVKRLCDMYNKAADDAVKFGCRIGLHNHTWEHGLIMPDGSSYWDYFFSHTSEYVCTEQDVGWSVCAGVDPCLTYKRYPHRSPTLHAKENGMGPKVKSFDAILGKPGVPGAIGVDWDSLIKATEKDGVDWYVVECERHQCDLSAVVPSYNFLHSKGLK